MAVRCIECGGVGKINGCAKCGKDSKKLNIEESKKETFITKARYSSVPDQYIGKVWSKMVLTDNNPKRSSDFTFVRFCDSLEKLHNKFMDGEFYNKSVFISAPSKMSKSILAYSCMQFALRSGLTVAPILDTLEVKRLLVSSSFNDKFKINKFITYDDYITRDIVFIMVTKTDYYTDAFTTILDLLSRRSRMGLPTFILSKFTMKDISQDSVDKEIKQLTEVFSGEDPLKYPVILEYKEVK